MLSDLNQPEEFFVRVFYPSKFWMRWHPFGGKILVSDERIEVKRFLKTSRIVLSREETDRVTLRNKYVL